ncbi:MAG: hypothetical protein ACJ780_26435 [Solirubrobacteraceae bacterium]
MASEARLPGAAGGSGPLRTAVTSGALLAATLLLVAEFLPLFDVRTSARSHPATAVIAGAHHAYALVPIAVLTAALALAWWRSPSRFPLMAIVVLGVATLIIAIARDLTDAQAAGIARVADRYVSAAASPDCQRRRTAVGAAVRAAGSDDLISKKVRFLTT